MSNQIYVVYWKKKGKQYNWEEVARFNFEDEAAKGVAKKRFE